MAIILNLETNIINRNHYCWSLGLALGLGSTVQAVDRFAEAVAGDVAGDRGDPAGDRVVEVVGVVGAQTIEGVVAEDLEPRSRG